MTERSHRSSHFVRLNAPSERSATTLLGNTVGPAVLLLIAWLNAPASANGPEIGREAGLVVPLASTQVQLVSEEVRIRLSEVMGQPGRCECTYRLRNLSEDPAEFEMAFLLNPYFEQEQLSWWYHDAGFGVKIDRNDVPVRWEPIAKDLWEPFIEMAPESLPVWRVFIAPKETVTVFMTHRIDWSGGSEGDSWGIAFTYRAQPARLWAGRIEHARIAFLLDGILGEMLRCLPESTECYGFSISPAGYRFRGVGLSWVFTDWEPKEDFRIGFRFSE